MASASRSLRIALWGALAASGCYPDFAFGPAGTGGGEDAAGGAPSGTTASQSAATTSTSAGGDGGAGTATATTSVGTTDTATTSTGGVTERVGVSCGPPTAQNTLVECAPSDVCCFDYDKASEDQCAASCDPLYAFPLECDGPEDCSEGTSCCAWFMFDPPSPSSFMKTTCASSCLSPDRPICHVASDCPNPGDKCLEFFTGLGYQQDKVSAYSEDYRWCVP